jgi:hypothetical protein
MCKTPKLTGNPVKDLIATSSTGTAIDHLNPFSKRTTTDFENMTKWVGNKRDIPAIDTSAQDEATARLRAETDRIYADLQKKRDASTADKVAAGEFDAQNALQAMASAFTARSGEEWSTGTMNRARRSTLLAGSSRTTQLARNSSASIAPLSSTATTQLTTAGSTAVRRLPSYKQTGIEQ